MRLDVQRRTLPTGFEMRGDAGSGATLIGHAAVFDVETIIMGMFREKISSGTFKKTIKESDVRALFNHEPNFVLGRNKAGTLRLSEDETGLAYEIDLPDTQVAKDLYTSIERGDVTQSSFAFKIVKEARTEPDEDAGEMLPLFDIKEARLFDVSPVTYPAYESTDVSVNSADDPIGYAVAIARFAEWCQRSVSEVHKYLEQIADDSERDAKLRQLWVPGGIPVDTGSERAAPAADPSGAAVTQASFNDLRDAVSEAIKNDLGLSNWVMDCGLDWAVYEAYDENYRLYQLSYQRADDDSITLGTPFEVEIQSFYVAVEGDEGRTTTPCTELSEAHPEDSQERSEADPIVNTLQEFVLRVTPEVLCDSEALTTALMEQLRKQLPELTHDEPAEPLADEPTLDAADTHEPPAAEERADTLNESDDTTDEPTADDAEPLASRTRVRKTLSTF